MSRLDRFLVEKGYFKSRSQAQLAINEGRIKVNGRIITKNGFDIAENDLIKYEKDEHQFVSRGGYKLLAALEKFNIDLKGKTVLDIGASTGGFTDCARQHGAKKIYAYDVGHDQLADELQHDERIISKEGVNCRNLTAEDFAEPIDFICMDVSFISCTKMLKTITDTLRNNGEAVILFKPQFEVGSQYLNRQGVVINDKITRDKLLNTLELINSYGMHWINKMESPIKGGDGNREYLIYLRKDNNQAL